MSGSSSQSVYPASLFNQYIIAFEGSSVACILYGLYLVIAGTNVMLLRRKRYKLLLLYSVIQLVITTAYIAVSLYAAPAQSLGIFSIYGSYTPNALSPWPSVFVDVAFILNACASDGFLLYRCYVVCMASKSVIAFPVLIYLATVGSAIAWVVVSSVPGAVYSTHTVQVAGIIFWSCSVAMNVCASFLICTRLLIHRRAIIQAVGSPQGTFYLTYMAMTLESALLYTAAVVVALVVFTLNSPFENVFIPVAGMVQVIAPSLIIYRIARGISFETDEYGTMATSTLRFDRAARPRAIIRPSQDDSAVLDAMLLSSVDNAKQRDSNSFIHDIKDKV